jgi:tellurite resistance protein TerC
MAVPDAGGSMHVTSTVWILTLVAAVAFLAIDILVIGRRPHEPSIRECALVLAGYLAGALAFGAGIWWLRGGRYAGEFYAGWLTEYSLSIDNLFVFILIMARFAVPRRLQQGALLIGIVLALVLRTGFIAAGAAVIETVSWIFYLFGAFLVFTAVRLAGQWRHEHRAAGDQPGRPAAHAEPGGDGRLVGWLRRRLPMTGEWRGLHLTSRVSGRRVVTPMALVLVALGTTDLLFALDSIPAIYGLTREPYLVLMANVFALMGLRQLYFLIGGLLQRLVYLSLGLSVLLAFIGAKLVLHALHGNELPFVNGGRPVGWAPDIPVWLSLVVIAGTLAVTTVASLIRDRRGLSSPPAPEPS